MTGKERYQKMMQDICDSNEYQFEKELRAIRRDIKNLDIWLYYKTKEGRLEMAKLAAINKAGAALVKLLTSL